MPWSRVVTQYTLDSINSYFTDHFSRRAGPGVQGEGTLLSHFPGFSFFFISVVQAQGVVHAGMYLISNQFKWLLSWHVVNSKSFL